MVVAEQPQWSKGPQGYGEQGFEPQGYVAAGGLTPQDERTWGLVAHLSGLVASFFFLGFLGPLVVLLVQGPRSSFVRRHAVEALNFWILMFAVGVVGGVIGALVVLLTLGIGAIVVVPVALAVLLAAVVFPILAAVAASNGRDYRYPVNVRLVK
jgi:uncharacterized Tic20 family protein